MNGIILMFHEGGPWMYPIFACLLATLTIAAERTYALFFVLHEDKNALLKGVRPHIMNGDLLAAIRFLSSQKQGPLSRILKAGLLKAKGSDLEVQAALDEASLREMQYIEKRVGFLPILSNGSTLFGLVGTVGGMIFCFSAVAGVDPAEKATILAKGISEAMNCTWFGLFTALPALFIYGWLQSRVQELTDSINEVIVTELNLVLSGRRLIRNAPDPEADGRVESA